MVILMVTYSGLESSLFSALCMGLSMKAVQKLAHDASIRLWMGTRGHGQALPCYTIFVGCLCFSCVYISKCWRSICKTLNGLGHQHMKEHLSPFESACPVRSLREAQVVGAIPFGEMLGSHL